MIQQSHFWPYVWKRQKLQFKKIHEPPVFIAALFIIAKTWKKPKCPLTNAWLKNIVCITHTHTHIHTHTRILFSNKKEGNNATLSNMHGPRDDHIRSSKSEKANII